MTSSALASTASSSSLPSKGAPPVGGEQALLRLARESGVLGCLSEQDLMPLLRHASLRHLRPRETLFTLGEAGSTLVLVLEGYMKLSSVTPCGREIVLEIAGPGRVFGELAVLNDWPRSADATALSACRVLSVDGRQLMQAMMRAPESLLATTRMISQRLRAATEQIVDAVTLPAPARLAKALLHLAALHSHAAEDGLHIDFELSQRELGGMTDLTRESINKHLSAWRDSGWVVMVGKTITLTDVDALQRLLGQHTLLA
jgi:CRP/FNR family transcriptional regulator, cyclic AMP receptor protein